MKKIVAIIVVLAIIVLGALFVSMNKKTDNSASGQTSNTSSQPSEQSSMQTKSSTNTTPQATNIVTIQDMAFSPGSITVKKGTTVTWTNKDAVAHTVVETDGKTGPKSGDLTNGQSYSFTYTTAGTFNYHCSIHPDMTGSVTVTE